MDKRNRNPINVDDLFGRWEDENFEKEEIFQSRVTKLQMNHFRDKLKKSVIQNCISEKIRLDFLEDGTELCLDVSSDSHKEYRLLFITAFA